MLDLRALQAELLEAGHPVVHIGLIDEIYPHRQTAFDGPVSQVHLLDVCSQVLFHVGKTLAVPNLTRRFGSQK